MTLNGEEHSGQGKLTMSSEQQELALEAALRQAIRAQYHFRASEQGLLAWDVRRLVRLSRDLPVQAVAHCQLMMAADLAYPILLDSAGRVMDGMHRVGKALLLGHSHIETRRFAVDPAPDYQGCDPDTLPYDD